MKVLGTGFTNEVGWTEIEVLVKPSGQPVIVLHGSTQEVARRLGIGRSTLYRKVREYDLKVREGEELDETGS